MMKSVLLICLLLAFVSSLTVVAQSQEKAPPADTALLLIDLQNDYFSSFKDSRWPLEGTEAAAAQAALLLKEFRTLGMPVVHVRHEMTSENGPFFLPGSEGAKIHASLAPVDGEAVIVKHRTNSFLETQLKETLEKGKIKNLVIVGAMSHMCVDAVTRAAADYGYNCTVIHDACATRELEFNGVKVPAQQVHCAFMAALKFAYAKVISTREQLDMLITPKD